MRDAGHERDVMTSPTTQTPLQGWCRAALAGALLALVLSLVTPAFLLLHWALAFATLVLAAFSSRAWRVPALAGALFLVVALVLGLAATGFGRAGAWSLGMDAATGTLLAGGAGVGAFGCFAGAAARGWVRGVGAASAFLLGAGLVALGVGFPEAVLALLFFPAALLGLATMGGLLVFLKPARAPA